MSQPAWPAVPAALAAGTVKSEVEAAVAEVRRAFPDLRVLAWPDGSGGAHVVIEDVALTSRWQQESTWVGFQINHMFPDSDTYPHYVRADLTYRDSTPSQVPITPGAQFLGVPALQVSRRTARHDPVPSAAANKTRSVIAWLRDAA